MDDLFPPPLTVEKWSQTTSDMNDALVQIQGQLSIMTFHPLASNNQLKPIVTVIRTN